MQQGQMNVSSQTFGAEDVKRYLIASGKGMAIGAVAGLVDATVNAVFATIESAAVLSPYQGVTKIFVGTILTAQSIESYLPSSMTIYVTAGLVGGFTYAKIRGIISNSNSSGITSTRRTEKIT